MKDGTFLVTAADDESAVLRDVADGQVHTLGDNPGVEAGEVLEATVEPEPPMEVTWQVVRVDDRRRVAVEESEEPPTRHEREIAADEVGELVTTERAGEGEIHVLRVPDDETEAAVADVLDDEATRSRAARLGVGRVEVRSSPGIVSVRYLP